MAFQKQQQQIEFLMDRPFLLDLQYLLSKLAEKEPLNYTDVPILDRAYSIAQSTEVANSTNQIFMLISNSPIDAFWSSLSTTIAHSKEPNTLIIMFSILSNRIRKEWGDFGDDIHIQIKLYIVGRINQQLEKEGDQRIIIALNQVLVGMLRFEWNSLFKDFVSNLESEGVNAPTPKLLNNLIVLRLLLEEGFNTKQELVPPSEFEQFRNSLEQDMRTILRLICQYFLSEGVDRQIKISKCLEALRYMIDYISPFELFNCNLIQLLVGLIGMPEFHHSLIGCFEQIFRFRQNNTSNSSHSKIAKKLLLILETYLIHFEDLQRIDYPYDKESASTEDSFHSRRTKKRNQVAQDKRSDFLNILYEFVTRYVPYMDKARGQLDLEIQYESNIKLYFSEDLYEAFGVIYWRIIFFLRSYLNKFDPFLFDSDNDQSLEQARKVVCCIRLMIAMMFKLKLQSRPQMKEIIQAVMLYLTPLPLEFVPYYLSYDLLQSGLETSTDPPLFSSDFEQEYKDFLSTILKQSKTCKQYFEIIEETIQHNDLMPLNEKDRRKSNMEIVNNRDLEKYSIIKTINSINRACWSSVYAYQCNYQATAKLPVTKLSQTLAKSTQMHLNVELQRCYSVNSKFITQIYYPSPHQFQLYTPLIASLHSSKNESVMEYMLLLLSKIFINEQLRVTISFDQLEMVVGKLHEIEELDLGRQTLTNMYPALIHLIIKMMETANEKEKNRTKDILEKLIGNQLSKLASFSKMQETRDQIDLQRTILLFIKLEQISNFLLSYIKNGKNVKNYSIILNWARTMLRNTFCQFEFKNKLFCQFLKSVSKENFDILHLLMFRKHYIQIFRSYLSLNMLAIQQPKSSPQKPKESQKINIMSTSEREMRIDFITQNQFKTKQYLLFALDFYRWMVAIEAKSYEEIINDSITEIAESLYQWQGDSQVILEYIKFWREIIKFFGLRLSKKNREFLILLLQEFERTTTQFTYIELIIDVFEVLIIVLTDECIKGSKALAFPEITSIFLKTFEKLFSANAKKQTVFEKIGHLLYAELEFIGCLPTPLQSNSKKDNIQTLYFILSSHISTELKINFGEQSQNKLYRLFKERNQRRWMMDLKEYVVHLTRIVSAISTNSL